MIFADPPYEASARLWPALAPQDQGWLDPGGVLVWETGHPMVLPAAEGSGWWSPGATAPPYSTCLVRLH